ncbi:MAG: hypothetical protein WDN75_19985 [Bacteroidota bacterium]
MKLVAGRNFEKGSLNMDQVIINEEAVQKLGYANAELAIGGKTTFITRRGAPYSTIIGVVKNFHQRSPKEKHIPMLFYYDQRTDYLSIRMNTAHAGETIESIKKAWDKLFPDAMFHYFFLDEAYNNQYLADARLGAGHCNIFGTGNFYCMSRTVWSFFLYNRPAVEGNRYPEGAGCIG